MRYYSRIPFLLLSIGLLASTWTAARRIMVERAARTVELTVDLEQLKTVAFHTGVPLPEALAVLKRAGVTSLAVEERSLRQLEEDHVAAVRPGRSAGVTEVRIADRALYRQVAAALRLKLHSAREIARSKDGDTGRREDRETGSRGGPNFELPASPGLLGSPSSLLVRVFGPGGEGLTIPAGWSAVQLVTVGLSVRDTELARAHGLGIVGRVSNFPTADDAAIAEVARRVHAAGAHTVVFLGEDVLGHRSRIKQTAAAMDAEGLRYGSVEFGKQMGDEELSRALESRIVRVHAIQGAEMDKMSPDAVVDRFVKAAEERNIRLLYLRLFPYVSAQPFQDNVDYIAAVARGLRARGMRLGIAEPLDRVYAANRASAAALLAPPTLESGRGGFAARLLSRLMPAISSLAVAGAAVLLLAALVCLPAGTQSLMALLASAAMSVVVLGGGDLGRELVALTGAMLFPVLALVWFPVAAGDGVTGRRGDRETGRAGDGEGWSTDSSDRLLASSPPRRVASPYLQFTAISLVSLMGALTVVGLLSEREFMVKVAQFLGIKAAHSLPLLAIALLYAAGAFNGPWRWPESRERARQNLGRVLGLRLELWHVLIGCAALAVLGILLARTGNDPGVGVSGTELSFRNMLDRFLVRPRTKEFLIGHPALLATLLLSARRPGRSIFIPLAIIGAIGQVSMVNSFCHLHTPLLMTLVRTLNGLWLGVLVGWAAARVIDRWLPAPSSTSSRLDEPLAARAPSPAGYRR
jgi:hypothetical protein